MTSKSNLRDGIIEGLADTFGGLIADNLKTMHMLTRESERLGTEPCDLLKEILKKILHKESLSGVVRSAIENSEDSDQALHSFSHYLSLVEGIAGVFVYTFAEDDQFEKVSDDIDRLIETSADPFFNRNNEEDSDEDNDEMHVCDDCLAEHEDAKTNAN